MYCVISRYLDVISVSLSEHGLRPRHRGALPPQPGQELQRARAQLGVHHRLGGRPLRQGTGRDVAADQGQGDEPRLLPQRSHGQPQPLPFPRVLNRGPAYRIAMYIRRGGAPLPSFFPLLFSMLVYCCIMGCPVPLVASDKAQLSNHLPQIPKRPLMHTFYPEAIGRS